MVRHCLASPPPARVPIPAATMIPEVRMIAFYVSKARKSSASLMDVLG